MVRQLKGKKHIRYIKRKSMRLWEGINYEHEMRDDCLREILKRHRERVTADFHRSQQKIAELVKESPVECQGEFSYPFNQCDTNGWIG